MTSLKQRIWRLLTNSHRTVQLCALGHEFEVIDVSRLKSRPRHVNLGIVGAAVGTKTVAADYITSLKAETVSLVMNGSENISSEKYVRRTTALLFNRSGFT